MERLTREITFEEEYIILQKEVKELFDKEDRESEPPKSHCVVRRALRCIKKLVAELEPYKEYKGLEGLKAIKSDGFTDDLLNMGFTKGYNKAIDDAKSVILQTLDNQILVDTLHLRLEQLKEQEK